MSSKVRLTGRIEAFCVDRASYPPAAAAEAFLDESLQMRACRDLEGGVRVDLYPDEDVSEDPLDWATATVMP